MKRTPNKTLLHWMPAALAVLFIAGLVLFSLPEDGALADDSAKESSKAKVEVAEGDVLMLFSINNVGFIDVCGCKKKKVRQGSIPRRASYVNLMRQLQKEKGKEVLLVDGGNTLFHDDDRTTLPHEKVQYIEKAKVIVEAYNRMDYKVMGVGNLDLVMGLDVLQELEAMARFPFTCANFVHADSGEPVFQPFVMVEVGDVKFGFFGLMIETVPQPYLDKRAPGTKITDPFEAAKSVVDVIRDQCDVVVAFSQRAAKARYGKDDESGREENQIELIEKVAGIDIVLDPFLDVFGSVTRKFDDEPYYVTVDNAVIVRTRPEGHSIGTLDLAVEEDGTPLVDRATATPPEGRSSFVYRRDPIEPHYLDDPEIMKLVDAFREGTKFVSTESLPPMPHKDKYLTEKTCQACHTKQHDFWKQTSHATAFSSLEETNDQWRTDCIGCHVLGYGQTFVTPKDSEPYLNVQCESCHGLNPDHPTDPEAHPWPRIQEKDCLTCHNKAQTREDFNFSRMKRKVACPKMDRP